MNNFYTLNEISEKTGLASSRLKYIEARFPSMINRQLFNSDQKLYNPNSIEQFKNIENSIINNLNISNDSGKIIVFASGKGGVGKTSLSVNLTAISAKKHKSILIDGDLGMANAHILLGLKPLKNISNLFSESLSINDIIINTKYDFDFISSGSGISELANLSVKNLNYLSDQFYLLKNKYKNIIIDCGAGIGKPVLNWVVSSDLFVVVTTPASTALLDVYGLIKVSLEKGYLGKILVIVNMVSSQLEGQKVFDNLNNCVKKFLNFELSFLGSIRKDLIFDKSLMATIPVILNNSSSYSNVVNNLNLIADRLF